MILLKRLGYQRDTSTERAKHWEIRHCVDVAGALEAHSEWAGIARVDAPVLRASRVQSGMQSRADLSANAAGRAASSAG